MPKENLFSDYKERVEELTKYCDLESLVNPLEECFGEKETYQSPREGVEFYLSALDELGKYAGKELKPTATEIDRKGATYKDGKVELPPKIVSHLKRFAELGGFGGPISRKYGGMNLPRVVQIMGLEIFGQACPNTALTIGCFTMGDFVEEHGTEEQKQKYLPKLATGQLSTAMALTEPNAGSDLGKLRTSGKKQNDGSYLINGSKIFITNGNADLVFTLVRTDPTSEGLKGLSVLCVERFHDGKENIKVTKIEDKICLHGSPTCELVFENSVGFLLGPENQGFKVMADLMNLARLAMGALSIGICVGALEEAKEYARTRVTMGKPIFQHPMIADIIYEAELEIRAMRALVFEASMAFDWMRIAKHRDDKKNFQKWKKRYRRLTPLCKYMGAEKVVQITRNALQVFGGYGVCRDYPVERLHRESLIFPIYEGTSQIQSLMVLKDTMKDVAGQATGFLGSLAGAWAESLVALNPVKSQLLQARNELNQGIKHILGSLLKNKFREEIEALKKTPIQQYLREFSLGLNQETDLTVPFLCAERFTRITCDYYALKCLADHLPAGDKAREKWILEFAKLSLPRMRLENHYMVNRLPGTLDYLKENA